MYSELLEFIKSEDDNSKYVIKYIDIRNDIIDRLSIWNDHNTKPVLYMSFYEHKILFNLFNDKGTISHSILYLNSVPDYDTAGEDVKFQISACLDEDTLFCVRVYQEIKKKQKCHGSYYL